MRIQDNIHTYLHTVSRSETDSLNTERKALIFENNIILPIFFNISQIKYVDF